MYYSKSHFNTTPGDYQIHTYDKIHHYNRIHDYNKIHEYNRIHEYNKIRQYDKIREYKYQEYRPTHTEPKRPRPVVDKPQLVKRKRKRESNLTWPDKPIYTHTYRPYEYIPPPQHREYEYREYKMNNENYFRRKIVMYNGSVDYKLTPENYYPFRYRRAPKHYRIKEDENNNEEVKRETSLRDIDLKDDPIYEPEARREEVLPSAIVIAPVHARKVPMNESLKPHSHIYEPEERNEPVLPSAIVIAPVHARKVSTRKPEKPPGPMYEPEVRQEEVLPSAFMIAPVHVSTKPEPVKSCSPETKPVTAAPRTAVAATSVQNVSPVQKTSPTTAPKRVYTPIGSRSPSPGLAPIGAVVTGGLIAAAAVNKTTSQDRVEKEQKQTAPQKSVSKSPSPSPKVQNAAVVVGVAGAVGAKSNNTESTPKTVTPQASQKPTSPSLHSDPSSAVLAGAIVGSNMAKTENNSKPLTPPPPPVNPARVPIAPVVETSEPVQSAPPKTEPVVKPAPAVAAVVPIRSENTQKPVSSKNNEYQEVPSSWSPLPELKSAKQPELNSRKGPTLPPEVVATIEAYEKAHDSR